MLCNLCSKVIKKCVIFFPQYLMGVAKTWIPANCPCAPVPTWHLHYLICSNWHSVALYTTRIIQGYCIPVFGIPSSFLGPFFILTGENKSSELPWVWSNPPTPAPCRITTGGDLWAPTMASPYRMPCVWIIPASWTLKWFPFGRNSFPWEDFISVEMELHSLAHCQETEP